MKLEYKFYLCLTATLTLVACGPKLECNDSADNKRLLETLYGNNKTNTTMWADDIIKLKSSCNLTAEQNSLVAGLVSSVAKSVNASEQQIFYSKLAEDTSSTSLRVKFIKESTLFHGELQQSTEQLKVVEFDQLGKIFTPKGASTLLLSNLKKSNYDVDDTSTYENFRVVSVNNEEVLFSIKTYSYTSTASFPAEKSELEFINATDGVTYITPTPDYSYGDVGREDAFNDYVYDTDVDIDTRYVVDSKGALKYLLRLRESAGDNLCNQSFELFQFEKKNLKLNSKLSNSAKIKCDRLPEEGEPHNIFQHFPEKVLLSKLSGVNHFDLVSLINFQKKDDADTDLKNLLVAQGDKWYSSFMSNVQNTSFEFNNAYNYDSYNGQYEYLKAEYKNITLLKWIFLDSNVNQQFKDNISKVENEITFLLKELTQLKPSSEPEKPQNPLPNAISLSAGLERQIVPYNKEGIPIINEKPYTYFGINLRDNSLAIVRSHRVLAENSNIVNILAVKAEQPMQFLVNGWTKNVWNYAEITDDEKKELNEYSKQMTLYQAKVNDIRVENDIKASKFNELTPKINELHEVLINLKPSV